VENFILTVNKVKDATYQVTNHNFNKLADLLASLNIEEEQWDYELAEKELEYILQIELSKASPSSKPKFTVISGIPFSGKSTFIKSNRELFRNSLFISFDKLMSEISYYNKLIKIDSELAFNKCESIARILGYELLIRALESRLSIVFEHSSTPNPHLDLYRAIIEDLQYEFDFVYIYCTVEEAQRRANSENMSRDGGRYTPLGYIRERYDMLEAMLNKYREFTSIKVVKNHEF